MEKTVERVVSQVLENHVPQLRQEIVRRVVDEVQPQLAGAPETSPGNLLEAIVAIHDAGTQRDVLRRLLDNAAHYCGRTALFVVRAGAVTGWQGRAFANNDSLKDFALDPNSALVGRALETQTAVSGSTREMDNNFVSEFGAPADEKCVLLPLMLKEKVAALVYADGGPAAGGRLDFSALQVLLISSGTWLEVALLRKAGHKEEAGESDKAAAAHAGATHATAFADPFAAHAPRHVQAAAAAPAVMEPGIPPAPAAATSAAASDSSESMAREASEVHKKAQRFARLLVDEIKLYNQAKVAEGRKNKDVYDRLKQDIDKSRSTYQKRYGNTVAATGDYFNQELVRSLGEDDVSLMGSNFRR